ncbi:MAG: isoleucine--tRNA ligase [Myxococcaceae bacterium]
MGDAEEPRDWKHTLNLPRTDFPMKGNLQALEPRVLAQWQEAGTFQALLASNAEKPPFLFHDGPPYANGHIHAGTALNNVLKDFVVKAQNMSGRRCDLIPGWDCHGLPIERAVEKRLKEEKVDRRTLSREDFLGRCRAYAQEFINIQRTELRRLGLFADWDTPYTTLAFGYEAQEIRELARVARRGLLFRKKKAVYWCVTDQTALAEADIEYADHTSPSIYVALATEPAAGALGQHERPEALADVFPFLRGRSVELAIWTTTPWTLPANLAVAVHPELTYVFYDLGARVLVVAKDLLPRLLSEIAPEHLEVRTLKAQGAPLSAAALVDPARILGYASGRELEGFAYRHPFAPRQGYVVLGEHVTLEQGTGLVHTAPGHGAEDYAVGEAYGLEAYNPVLADGRFDDTVQPPSLKGRRVFDANPEIVQLLLAKGALLNRPGESITHSYPHCDRCKNPVIFRATPQWFVSLDRPLDGASGPSLRTAALQQVDEAVSWIPDWGKQRIRGMLENRPDWTLSRQRLWGVPIPVALCASCGEGLVSPELMDRVAARVEEEGAGAWYRLPLEHFLPEPPVCTACGGLQWTKGTDILDVWFDSACSFAVVMEPRYGPGPVDLYLEGSDQHRGWFHSSLLVSVATRNRAPYRRVLTHGFVVDGDGRKMSKSLGNVVAPEKIISQYGAELLRLWVASSDYRDDIRLSDGILKSLAEGYRKIRNTLRYALSNLADFDPAKHSVPDSELLPLDRWAKGRLEELVARVRRAYDAYEFHLVYHAVVDFCGNDLSALFFDISKDRLYTWKTDGHPRRSGQTVLYRVAADLLRLLAPVMSFTAEEAWAFLPGNRAESVFLAGFPAVEGRMPAELGTRFERLFAIRSVVQKQLEAARRDKLIGASLEAKVLLQAEAADREFLERHLAELPGLFIVSQVELPLAATPGMQRVGGGSHFESLGVEVRPADGAKCPRCWTYTPEVAAGAAVCNKCQAALG